MRFVKCKISIFVFVKPRIVVSVAKHLLFKAMAFKAKISSKAIADPTITAEDMQNVMEKYLWEHGNESFQNIISLITKENTSWTSRPKVSVF